MVLSCALQIYSRLTKKKFSNKIFKLYTWLEVFFSTIQCQEEFKVFTSSSSNYLLSNILSSHHHLKSISPCEIWAKLPSTAAAAATATPSATPASFTTIESLCSFTTIYDYASLIVGVHPLESLLLLEFYESSPASSANLTIEVFSVKNATKLVIDPVDSSLNALWLKVSSGCPWASLVWPVHSQWNLVFEVQPQIPESLYSHQSLLSLWTLYDLRLFSGRLVGCVHTWISIFTLKRQDILFSKCTFPLEGSPFSTY